ncbi:hypothetical protein GCM10027277_19650 [Pseudoduganella ginsengisoli]|uniref:DUF2306 domain-containing protein n=1 Tax=Pseudoduganella ginsengisoli TaxID=1462440 RepID=A0A6L6PU59_9BURK|nr:hypothetical protein [Pseudoduganella ginsengisoli]MTW00779.1 hypothetical protein [Pseudoduganella ginsengisoli]
MSGITLFGTFHTVIGLGAVIAGARALLRDGAIRTTSSMGKVYAGLTLVTSVSALAIFHHGGFGVAHVLALITLATMALAALAQRFGKTTAAMLAWSATYLFHWVPAVTETLTRVPAFGPLTVESPAVKNAHATLLVLFLAGATWQFLRRGRLAAAR